MKFDLEKKKYLVDRYLQKNKMVRIFDIYFENIENVSMYILFTYQVRSKTYRVNWIDLTAMENKNVSDWFNSNLLFPEKAEQFKSIIAKNALCKDYVDTDKIDSKVIMNSYITNYNPTIRKFEFMRYIPNCWSFLSNAIFILFTDMPRNCFSFYQIMLEKIIKPEKNYMFYYDKNINNIENFFDQKTKEAGEKIFNSNSIRYIEKVKDVYYGIVDRELVEIVSNENVKEMQLLCTCNCKSYCQHIYACLMAIKYKTEKRFYKISYKDDNLSLLERIEQFNYLLCLGIDKDSFIVVRNNQIVALPILDKNKDNNWEIIEDDDKETLKNNLNKFLGEQK